ncbi:DUF4357 domain-containing protein [Streptomyces sp. NPDC006798]|uniref:DUF4357 domain-containing protein n=1 Tax=Streptomyces sp. NPDC006798 TaxID=3155462 RepID=UPI0033DDA5F7
MPTVSLSFDKSVIAKLVAAGPDETVHLTLSLDVTSGTAQPAGAGSAGAVAPQGPLAELLREGLLTAGDVLSFRQQRAGREAVATVASDGRLVVEGHAMPYASPSKAASAVTGSPANGWLMWRTADGCALTDLRDRLRQD